MNKKKTPFYVHIKEINMAWIKIKENIRCLEELFNGYEDVEIIEKFRRKVAAMTIVHEAKLQRIRLKLRELRDQGYSEQKLIDIIDSV